MKQTKNLTSIYKYWGEQSAMYNIGKSGCYFLALARMGQQYLEDTTGKGVEIDIIELYYKCVEKGYLGENCYVYNPTSILFEITKCYWWCEKQDNDKVIQKTGYKQYGKIWVQPNGYGGHHFACNHYEPLKNRIGTEPISWRIFYVKEEK